MWMWKLLNYLIEWINKTKRGGLQKGILLYAFIFSQVTDDKGKQLLDDFDEDLLHRYDVKDIDSVEESISSCPTDQRIMM